MKNTLILLSSVLLLTFTSCKSKSKSSSTVTDPVVETTSENQPKIYQGVTNDSCAVELAFGSYGAGIDGKALEAVTTRIEEKKLKYTAKSIGREGEIRICLPLTEIKGKEKSNFIDQLKKIALEGQLVSLSIR